MGDVNSTLEKVVDRFNEKFEEHGAVGKGVDYNSDEAQILRFAQLVKLLPENSSFSLLDYGCGYGALVDFLRARDCDVDYIGYDLSDKLVAHATDAYSGMDRARFTTDLAGVGVSDYVIACGVFNIKLDMNTDEWREYFYRELDKLAGLATKGFAFNSLTAYSDPEYMREDLFYPDPREVFDYCVRNISRHVAVLHDYPLYDCTYIVRFHD